MRLRDYLLFCDLVAQLMRSSRAKAAFFIAFYQKYAAKDNFSTFGIDALCPGAADLPQYKTLTLI